MKVKPAVQLNIGDIIKSSGDGWYKITDKPYAMPYQVVRFKVQHMEFGDNDTINYRMDDNVRAYDQDEYDLAKLMK